MNFPLVRVIFEPTKTQYTIPTIEFYQMTTKDILRDALQRNNLQTNNTKSYTLFIQSLECDEYVDNSPCFRFSPPINSKPIDSCNSLSFLPKNQNSSKLASFYISIERKKESNSRNKISFSIPVISKKDQKFMYSMPITELNYPFDAPTLKEIISDVFPNHDAQNDVEFFDIFGRPIKDDERCSNLTSYILKGRIFATFDFTEKDIKKINERINIIREIFDTENKYSTFLKLFEENCKKFFEETPIFKPEIYKDFFHQFLCLPKLHQQIYERVNNLVTVDFMSRVGPLYKNYAPMLKMYSEFNSQYEKINKKIEELKKNEKNAKYFETFQETPYAQNRDISQILSEPFQRAMRYPLLFKRLLGSTSKNHPDYQILQQTVSKMEESIQQNNKNLSLNASIDKINLIQQNLIPKYNLIEADRRYIKSFIVYYGTSDCVKKQKKRKNTQSPSHSKKSLSTPKNKSVLGNIALEDGVAQECILILFTNLIIIARKNSNKNKFSFTILSDIPINSIGIHPYGKQSIYYCISTNNIYSCSFLSPNNSNSNLKELNQAVKFNPIVNNQNQQKVTMIATFTNPGERDTFFKKYRKHSLLTFLVKSQRNFSLINQNKFGTNSYQTSCYEIESICPRKNYKLKDHSIALVKDAIWVFGGINSDNELQNRLFRIKIATRSVSYHKSQPGDITPRSKALMIGVKDSFYVFGGTNGEVIFNDLWHYSCKQFKWTEIKCHGKNPTLPEPSLGYSLNYIESKDTLILIGGHQKFNVYLFDFMSNIWGTIPLQSGYVPRNLIGHQTVPIDNETFLIIGGQFSAPNSDELQYNNAVLVFKPFFSDGISIAKTSGFQPMDISFHHAAKISKHFIVVFAKGNLNKPSKSGLNQDSDENRTMMFLLNLTTKKWSVIYQNQNKMSKHFCFMDGDAFTYDPPDLNIANEDENLTETTHKIYFFGGLKYNNDFQSNLISCSFHLSANDIKDACSDEGGKDNFVFNNDTFLNDILMKNNLKEFHWYNQPMPNPFE